MSMGYLIVTALVALAVADAAIFLILMGAVMTRAIAEMTRTKWGDVAGAFAVAFVAMMLAVPYAIWINRKLKRMSRGVAE